MTVIFFLCHRLLLVEKVAVALMMITVCRCCSTRYPVNTFHRACELVLSHFCTNNFILVTTKKKGVRCNKCDDMMMK